MRIKLTIEYDGTLFCGWQVQPGLRTVQGELEDAIKKLTGEETRITASGRTDAGVHAMGQVAHFDTNKDLGERFVSGLNHFLPHDIRIKSVQRVSNDFHARFSAKRKTYIYVMYESNIDSALLNCRATRTNRLNVAAMNRAASLFVGKHDFSAFKSTGSDTLTSVRTVEKASVKRRGGFVIFSVTADGFLYNMVRKMAAALVLIGRGENPDIASMLSCGAVFAPVAPPDGLYLYEVRYDN